MPETITSQVPKSVSEVLNAAADLLDKPGAWTRGCLGRDSYGNPITNPFALDGASCLCAAGAIWRVKGSYPAEEFSALRNLMPGGVGPFNDDLLNGQAEVVAALRAAASKSESPNV